MNKFDVYTAKVPFREDKDKFKIRPVLVIGNHFSPIDVAPVTSHSPRDNFNGEYLIQDLQAAGIYKKSTVRLSQIFDLNRENLLNKIGHLSDIDIENIEKILSTLNKK